MDQQKNFKKRLYKFTLKLLKTLSKLPFNDIYSVLRKQLTRSGTSIIANYIEAQAASSRRDYVNFFNHSLKSANESKLWIVLIKDLIEENNEKIDTTAYQELLKETVEIANIFGSSILTLKKKKKI